MRLALSHVVQRGWLVILESTTYPGTTREALVPLLERCGLKVGEGLNVALPPNVSIPDAPTTRCATRARGASARFRGAVVMNGTLGFLTLRSANNDAP